MAQEPKRMLENSTAVAKRRFFRYNSVMNIAVVIPAWNEERRIQATVKAFLEFKDRSISFSEIIIADDGSKDQTSEQCRSFSDSRVRVVGDRKMHHGKGWAVRAGILAVSRRAEWILVSDADCSVPIADIHALIPFTATHDVIIGSRAVPGAVIQSHQPAWRETLGRLGNRLIQLLLLPGLHDTQCGFKLYSRSIQRLAPFVRLNGWGYDFELLYLARKADMTIAEAPVRWRHGEHSKVRWTAFATTLRDLLAVRWNEYRGYYRIKT